MIKERIETQIKEAMKRQEALRLSVLRLLSTAIHNREIEKRTKSGTSELTDEEVIAVIRSEAKKRREAIGEFQKGGRLDLAEKESAELKILEEYLPQEMPDGELEKVVGEIIAGFGEITAGDFGRVMGQVMKELKGRVSGERVSAAVKKFLQQ